MFELTARDGATEAVKHVRLMLPTGRVPTTAEIAENLDLVIPMLLKKGFQPGELDREAIIRRIELDCNVFVPPGTGLESVVGHVAWLPERQADIAWRFWSRYRRYLEEVVLMPPPAIERLDEVTYDILRRLEDPQRSGAWDRRGMVVGQVQSGKTGNYLGLICRAMDAGYRLIVVLAGLHNSLRSQTQLRLDEGVLGFDTQQRMLFDQSNLRLGVGNLPGQPLLHVHSLTSSAQLGDFNLTVAKNAGIMVGGSDPVVLVVKKNGSILRNLLKWATQIRQEVDPTTGRSIVRDVPLLVIDDEADNASINTNKMIDEDGQPIEDADPTVINRRIRTLLNSFEKSAYVAYTATPFANIYIADDVMSEDYGPDLFPESFIIALRAPTNHMGPAQVFGLTADREVGIEARTGLPIIQSISDYGEWMPDRHKSSHRPGDIPESLRTAIRSFILACAARLARGHETAHNSMLVHVTRYTNVQAQVDEQVRSELEFTKARLLRGDGRSPHQLGDEMRSLWHKDFVATTRRLADPDTPELSWEQIQPHLSRAAAKIEVRRINGTARDVLEYVEHPKGLSVIAIGGDKLSRGLTLEGLSVSYYLRASRMYDTLMQMGRWFGYRPGYLDLCRLFTSTELVGWYRDIATADEELRREFEDMATQGATPREYGLRVRTHPDGLMITASTKMRNGTKVLLSFSHTIVETIMFDEGPGTIHENLMATERLARRLRARRTPATLRDNFVWHDVEATEILEFLGEFTTHEKAQKARAPILKRYIEARRTDDELDTWTVVLVSNPKASAKRDIGGSSVGLTKRSRHEDADQNGQYVIRRLVSPPDEHMDLTEPEFARALDATVTAWHADRGRSKRDEPPTEPSGPAIRRTRPPERGLLLIYPLDPSDLVAGDEPFVGFAISFPRSEHSSGIEYVVTNLYWQQEFAGE